MSERDHLLHVQIRRALEARIRSGQWGPGTRIPTEVELCQEFEVSRITVQRALRDLADAGLIVRFRKRGSFVAQAIGQHNLLRFTGLLIQGPETHGDHLVVSAQVLPASTARLRLPGLPDEEAVVQMERHKLRPDGHVMNTELHVLPFRLAPDLLDQPLEPLTTHAYLRDRGVELVRARLYVEPYTLTGAEAEAFGLQAGAPVFRWTRETWTRRGEIAEILEMIVPPGSERFYVETDLSGSSDHS
ncbi:GntR family transcriptional regulator/GntR family transcriptional regulator, histidine utilization repressor [Nonomuraea solani]|uniref:GntR family transcriptional regulator/GntR family transcriptional regulator, histidine utilization repressor n=1 Tax=Nonomuraea solani TaxID=1144553 RepID=A0A1H6EU22_9ACTN|nr:GntR family transcriptional regulator [Nonomuraea solani]SEH01282.1 GntR family transcriptional regulator/GntR family transcriptional regulator, histidine utilization repressor [Nonomuraea solani]